MKRCFIPNGVPLESKCGTCQHPAGDHSYPTHQCVTCLAEQVDDLEHQIRRLVRRISDAGY